jgi:hypothetical protein
LEVNEAHSRSGASMQDVRSGQIAIDLGIKLRRGEISRQELLFLIEVRVGDPENTFDGPRPVEEVSDSLPLACRILPAC